MVLGTRRSECGEHSRSSTAISWLTRTIAQKLWLFVGWGCFLISAAFAGPIHDAAKAGDADALAKLLDAGENIEEQTATGETPLISASLAGQTKIVEFLLARHAMIEARNNYGLTPLHAVAYGGHADTAAVLIAHGAAVDDDKNRYHTTPLIVAAEDGHTEIVKLLAGKGAKLEVAEVNGFTALTQALFVEKWETVDVLLAAGATCQPKEILGESLWVDCNKRKK